MIWKIINEDYTDFLRDKYEPRIPHTNYGQDKYKPFFGELFTIGDLTYVTQVTSPKSRHNKLKQSVDFYKIYDNNNQKLIACINLNFMFPVPNDELSDLNYNKIGNLVSFETESHKSKYIRLLKLELSKINQLNLEETAKDLYKRKCDFPNDIVS